MNPIKRMDQLSRAVGLQVLKLSSCSLAKYLALDVMPSLVELDVSGNELLNDLDPVTGGHVPVVLAQCYRLHHAVPATRVLLPMPECR
jgi:hypothetical protein